MRFAVLIKQVPADLRVPMNADFTIDREQMQKITNPADQSALVMAADWKRRLGGEIACITMGPPAAAECLREAAMSGADELYHICDRALARADTLVTAEVLAAALRHIGGADLILCGRHTVDGETGQVGPELAAMLGYACLSQAVAVDAVESGLLRCSCLSDGDIEVFSLSLPAVLCVCECRTALTLPSLAMMRRAAAMPVQTLCLRDLGLAGLSGRQSSPTRVCAVHPKAHERRHTAWLGTDGADGAASAIAEVIRREKAGRP